MNVYLELNCIPGTIVYSAHQTQVKENVTKRFYYTFSSWVESNHYCSKNNVNNTNLIQYLRVTIIQSDLSYTLEQEILAFPHPKKIKVYVAKTNV